MVQSTYDFDTVGEIRAYFTGMIDNAGQWAVRVLNSIHNPSVKSDIKFHSIERYNILPQPMRLNWARRHNACVVYTLWGNPNYLKLAYLSILSQLVSTDVLDVDVRVVVQKNTPLERLARELLSVFGDPDMVVPVNMSISGFKYLVPAIQQLQRYDVLVMNDTDSFMWFPKRQDIYAKIAGTYAADESNMFHSYNTAGGPTIAQKLEFAHTCAVRNGPEPNLGKVQFYRLMQSGLSFDLAQQLQRRFWPSGHMMVLRRGLFASDGYVAYAHRMAEYGVMCDEAVMYCWLMHLGIAPADMRELLPDVSLFAEKIDEHLVYYNDFNHNVHSIGGGPTAVENCVNANNIKFFNKIEMEAWKTLP